MGWLMLSCLFTEAHASVFDDCVLKNIPAAQTDYAAKAIKEVCVGTSERQLPLDLLAKLSLNAKYGSYFGGGSGLTVDANNQTGYDITEIRFQIVNKDTGQVSSHYSIKTFYGGSIFPYILLAGQTTALAYSINETPIPGKKFFDTYTWRVVGLKGWSR